MAFRFFPTRSETWLEAELAKLEEQLVQGGSIVSASGGDASATRPITVSIEKRMEMIYSDLSILNPTDYPPESGPTTETKVSFS